MVVHSQQPAPSLDAEPPPDGKRRWWRSSVRLVASFVVPLILCVPAVIELRSEAQRSRNSSAILTRKINALEPQIADIKDTNRVRAELLSRKQILKVLDSYAPRSTNVLGIVDALPSGVRLLSAEMKDVDIVFEILCVDASRENAFLDLLKQRGFRDTQVSSRSHENGGGGERLAIHTSPERGARE